MGLFNIIDSISKASGTKAKQAIIEEHKDNELFRTYLWAMLSNDIKFGISRREVNETGTQHLDVPTLNAFVLNLSSRRITGNAAVDYVETVMKKLTAEDQWLIAALLDGTLRSGFSTSTVNKAFGEEFIWDGSKHYMRCSLPSDKSMSKFDFKDAVVQIKYDGAYHEVGSKIGIRTRSGKKYKSVPGIEARAIDGILMGEFVVYHNDQVLDRKTGNGMLNSLQQGSDLPSDHKVVYHVWDWRPEDKDCDIPYTKRLETARKYDNGDTIKVVKGVKVNNYQEALSVAGELIANGYEGGILKDMNMPWRSGTSKQQVKLKVECDIDLLAVEFVKGDANGKHANTFGSIKCRSSDGKIEVDVTGMPDSQREHLFNNPQEVIGKVVTVTFNDIIESKTDRETASLFLPRFGNKQANGWFEIRNDKLEADSSERIIEIFEATTGIRKELKK